jgi:tetratricopeptide (TPR) repeat protein
MRRALIWSLLVLLFLVVAAVGTVLTRAEPSDLAEPDPALPIRLPDGSHRPLAEVLALARGGGIDWDAPRPEPLVAPDHTGANAAITAPTLDATLVHAGFSSERIAAIEAALARESPVFRLAEIARQDGRLDEAAALYLSVPEDDPRYGRAQRRLAWDVLTKGQGQPRRAVAHAHAALAAEPFDGNSWQDFARVYGATLGIDVDEWD